MDQAHLHKIKPDRTCEEWPSFRRILHTIEIREIESAWCPTKDEHGTSEAGTVSTASNAMIKVTHLLSRCIKACNVYEEPDNYWHRAKQHSSAEVKHIVSSTRTSSTSQDTLTTGTCTCILPRDAWSWKCNFRAIFHGQIPDCHQAPPTHKMHCWFMLIWSVRSWGTCPEFVGFLESLLESCLLSFLL